MNRTGETQPRKTIATRGTVIAFFVAPKPKPDHLSGRVFWMIPDLSLLKFHGIADRLGGEKIGR